MTDAGMASVWRARIMTLPVGLATIVLGLALFLLDSFSVTDGAASALYVAVLVLPGGLWQRRGVLAVTGLCIAATAATYVIAHGFHPVGDSIFRRIISGAAIVVGAMLVLRSLSEINTLDEQARLLDLTDDAIFVRDAGGVITYWNRGAERMYGWASAEALGQSAAGLLATQFPSPCAVIDAALANHGRWDGELINAARDGRQVIVASRWAAQPGANGVAILETGTDVTRKREAAIALRRSEARHRAIFHTAGVAIWEEDFSALLPIIQEVKSRGVIDMAQFCDANIDFVLRCVRLVRLRDVNESAVRMFEADRREDLLESLERIYLPGTAGSFAAVLVALAEGAPSCEGETAVRTLGGRILTVRRSITFPPEQERMNAVLVSIMDVTERQRALDSMMLAQESLARVTQISTLGEVTASIAHEVNQPLAAIVTNAEACLRWLHRPQPDMAEAGDAIARVIRDGQHATEVVARIRAFLGKKPLHRAPFQFAEVVEEASRLVRRDLLQHDVSLHLDLAAGLPPIMGDRLQIEQVILNLLINAIQSMATTASGGRVLTLRVAVDDEFHVRVTVSDSGGGITPEDMRKLFQPFFTTKPDGMGLGLTICRSIIVAHGGDITASSHLGQGTVVQFTLPTVTATAARPVMAMP